MVEIKGLDKIQRELEELQRNVEELDGEHQVSFSDIFPDYFMMRNTDFATIDEMFEKSGFSFKTQEDFEAIPEEELDEFVRKHSRFETWEEMKQTAGMEWVQKKMGFDVGEDE